ncbi:TPA: hypothetical protein ACH0S9_004534, partial [Citrobacter werkmanii]
ITQENPYKFSRAKEKAFLNHMIDKASKSGNLATEKGSQLKELMHGVDDSAADIEKKCPAYTRYQRLKNQYHAKNQPTEYIPSIEVITNDFARTGLLYSKWIH